MKTSSTILQLFLLICLALLVKADLDPLQDYCVADTKSPFFINGAPCINPNSVLSSHFATSVLAKPGETTGNQFGFNVTLTTTADLPGLNTQGLTLARVDIAGDGMVPPHSHPRASEVTTCLSGALYVGFITTSGSLFTQQLRAVESFVFPKGLIHFLYNLDSIKPALALSGLSSENPGAQISPFATFTSNPWIPNEILTKAFQINGQDISKIRRNLGG